MGILVKSTSVKDAVQPRLITALTREPASIGDAPAEAAGAAAEVQASTRETTIDVRILVLIVAFVAFIVVAGMVAEFAGIPEWGDRLVTTFNVLWPLLLGYFGGEFVAEKTK